MDLAVHAAYLVLGIAACATAATVAALLWGHYRRCRRRRRRGMRVAFAELNRERITPDLRPRPR